MATRKFLFVDADGNYQESAGAYETADFINTSAGAGDAGKPIVLDADGKIDATMLDAGDIDHGGLTGLGDDDHPQYHNDTRGDIRYYTKTILNSTSNGDGASLIGIEDSGGLITATTVEGALQELAADIAATDHHSGWFFIQTGTVVNVDEYKQMRVKGTLTVEGATNITGMLVLD